MTPETDAIDRTEAVLDDDQELLSLVDTGGETEYAHIYLATYTGTHNGNKMLWVKYIWLSKPGAFENDMVGDNGISIRLVGGMEDAIRRAMMTAMTALENDGIDDTPAFYEA